MSIIAIEAGDPGTTHQLVFTDALQTISLGSRDRAVHQFVHDLRIAGRIQRVDEIFRGSATHGLRDAVAVAVVDINDAPRMGWLSSKS